MNKEPFERIIKQTDEYFDDLSIVFSRRAWMEKFAELIVLESVNAVMDGTKEGDHYAMRIENHFDSDTGGVLHFGVEE